MKAIIMIVIIANKIIIDILRKYLNSFSDNGFSYVSIGHIIKINNDANPLIISSKVWKL